MQQFIGFSINSGEYMIPILKVREIIGMPSVTALPHLPSYVRGVTNLRGSIVPIVNLKHLIESCGSEGEGNTVIVLTTGQITFGIVVDGITGVVNADESEIEPPENFFKNNADNIKGVAKMNNKLVVLLDAKRLLPLDDMSLLEDAILNVTETENGKSVEVSREVDTSGGKVIVRELYDAKEYFSDKLNRDDTRQNTYNLMLEFMDALADREYQKAEGIIEQMLKETDCDLFNEVGKITRKLHDSLDDFKGALDTGLQKLTEDDVPNAVDKLQFVITRTEEAANKTMGIVERYFEESDEFTRQIEGITGDEDRVEYLRTLKESLDNDMTSILTAQQFQDITGQTIKKVISLVNHVEAELLRLVTHFGMSTVPETDKKESSAPDAQHCPDSEKKPVEKVSQSDVEALLKDAGF